MFAEVRAVSAISRRVSVFAVIACCSAGLTFGTPAFADTEGDYHRICDQTISAGQGQNGDQKFSQCEAAKTALDGASAQSALWKVYAGVAAVCTAACATSLLGSPIFAGQEYVCMGAGAAAAVTEGIYTKQIASALMSAVMSVGPGLAMKALSEPAAEGAPKKKDYSACFVAAGAALNAGMKYSDMNNQEGAAKDALKSAENLDSANAAVTPGRKNSTLDGSNKVVSGDGAGPSTVSTGSGSGSTPTATACNSAKQTSSVADTITCAAATDSNLPAWINTPGFLKDYQKTSGQSFGDFLGKAGSPSSAITGSLGGALSANQIAHLSPVIAEAVAQVNPDVDGSSYAGGGGRGGMGGGEADDGAAMIQGLLGQLMPKDGKGNDHQRGVASVMFASKKKGASALADDRTLSIFDRISYRYIFVNRRMSGKD